MKKLLFLLMVVTMTLQSMQQSIRPAYTSGKWKIAIRDNDIATLQRLILDAGTNVNTPDKQGFTLIGMASALNRPDVIEFLVRSGVDINQKDQKYGFTALHDAAWEDSLDSLQKLIDLGADPFLKNCEGHTPLDIVKDELTIINNKQNHEQIINELQDYMNLKLLGKYSNSTLGSIK